MKLRIFPSTMWSWDVEPARYSFVGRKRSIAAKTTDDEGSPERDAAWIAQVRSAVAGWTAGADRDLPWRGEKDAYRVLVSESMLVQTTVAAVVPYYHRFIQRFPTPRDLAAADESDVLKHWEGLGYYRRARQLHAAAQEIVAAHDGIVPENRDALLALPGVGRYIAGAILSFAFDRAEPIVEANTQRILARLIGLRETIQSSPARTRLWEVAERLVPEENAGSFNQKLMDLGATICIPGAPMCLMCPLSGACRARELGLQDEIPRIAPRAEPTPGAEECAIVIDAQSRVLLIKRRSGGLWDGFWEFPTIHVSGADPAGRKPTSGGSWTLEQAIEALTGVRATVGPVFATLKYAVTRYKMTIAARPARALDSAAAPRPSPAVDRVEWVEAERLSERTFSSPGRRLADRAAKTGLDAIALLINT